LMEDWDTKEDWNTKEENLLTEEVISGEWVTFEETDEYNEDLEDRFIIPHIGPIQEEKKLEWDVDWNDLKAKLSSHDDKEHLHSLVQIKKYLENQENGSFLNIKTLLPLLNESLYSYNPNIQIAASRVLSTIAKNESILLELKSMGTLSRMEYLRTGQIPRVSREMDVAIDNIYHCVRLFGLGPNPEDNSEDPIYERVVTIKQEKFKRCGVGHRLWPAAFIMSRWIFENKDIFKGKKVLEVGCGPALAGLVVAPYCESVLMTDYLDIILKMVDKNIQLNKISNAKSAYINWEEVAEEKIRDEDIPECDIIIGSDVVYGASLAISLGKTLAKFIKSRKAIFYGCMQENRIVKMLDFKFYNYLIGN